MTRRRRGFTLVETLVALALAGLVATLGYAALATGLDVDQRVRRASLVTDDDTRWRALATDALRHMTDAGEPGVPALRLSPSGLSFRTTAFGTPSGAGAAWRVIISAEDSVMMLRATNDETGAQLVASGRGAASLRGRAQSLGEPGTWQDAWQSPSVPALVRIDFGGRDARAMPPLLVAIGLRQ